MTNPKYTDEYLDRLERESEKLIDEALASLQRMEDMQEEAGLTEAETTVTEFFERHGSSAQLDELRREHIGDVDINHELLEEEKRLMKEAGDMDSDKPGGVTRRRRNMTRI